MELGVSIRTVERLVASGRLSKKTERRKTRPAVVFDVTEVAQLKEELQAPDKVFRRLNASETLTPNGVGFRLDPFYIKSLKERGELVGLSAGEYARKLVVQGLEDSKTEAVLAEVRQLQRGLGDFFYALLVLKLGVSEGEASRLVKETILAS